MKKGIIYIILSGICFIVVNLFVKILGGGNSEVIISDLQKYPPHELVLARCVVSFIISLFIIKKKKIKVFGENKKWLIIRGLSGTIALTIFFYTIHYLPLAIASTIQYLAPIFTIIIAMLFFKERIKKIQWIFILISFLGIVFISLNKMNGINIINGQTSLTWITLGLISAVFSAIAYSAIVKLKDTDQPITIVIYFPMVAIPLMILLCLFDFTIPQGIEWFFLIIIGIFTQFAQILMTKALHIGNTSEIIPFQYLGAVYAFLVGYFIFNETLNMITNIGISLVIIGVIVNVIIRKN